MSCVPEPMKSLAIPREELATRRFRFLDEADRSVFRNIRRGVIFVMAFWSGPARLAFAELKRTLGSMDRSGQIELVVVDIDGISPDFCAIATYPFRFGGSGESVWIKDENVIDVAYGTQDYEARIRDLLSKQEMS